MVALALGSSAAGLDMDVQGTVRTSVSSARIASDVIRRIVAHACDEHPRECCGLLLGRSDGIVDAWRARNVSPTPRRRYLVDPADHFRAIREARARGCEVLGAYHSHPSGPAEPSETDRAEADDPGWMHVIVTVAGRGAPELRAFRIVLGNILESRLVPMA